MATSIVGRPLDLLIVIVLATFALIAVTIDFTQSVYGSVVSWTEDDYGVWPPAFILEQYVWWCKNVDTLVEVNPMWIETMAWYSPFLYTPFYIAAIYAFIFEKEWIRVPALMWGWGLLLCMFPILRESIYGEHQAKNLPLFLLGYGGYLLMPVLVMLRVACTPVFSTRKKKPE